MKRESVIRDYFQTTSILTSVNELSFGCQTISSMVNLELKQSMVVACILEALEFSDMGQNVLLTSADERLADFDSTHIELILNKLAKKKLIRLISKNLNGETREFELQVLNTEGLKELNPGMIAIQPTEKGDSFTKYSSNSHFFIEFNAERKILLNGKIELAKPDFNNENELFFLFLYEHPNTNFSRSQIERAINITLTKGFDKTLENLGFRKGLKSAFFDINGEFIRFKKPVNL